MSRRLERARLLSVGDELLAGNHPDLNAPFIARELGELGLNCEGVEVVPDDRGAIAAAVNRAAREADLVVVTGGLGPTLDDVTRHGIADALGVALALDPEAEERLRRWYAERGVDMPEANLRQALFPLGARVVANRTGTAPGFRCQSPESWIVSLPGPPPEMKVVLSEEILPWLVASGLASEPLPRRRFYISDLSESLFAERVGDWMEREASPRMGCSVKKGVLHVNLRARGREPEDLLRLEERVQEFRARFREEIFSEDEARIEFALGRALIGRRIGFSAAESCTGGLATALLTRVPGISACLSQSFVTYSNAAKIEELGVSAVLIETHGAVSREVAEAMAAGAAARSGAELGVAVTGIAGPEGGSEEKPVGLVWFATSFRGRLFSNERRYPPDRQWIQTLAAHTVLGLGLRRLSADD